MNTENALQKPCLVILAAGIGSRYGGLKQLESIGPRGEALLDYSASDALQAGFGKIVLVVREEILHEVQAHVARTFGQATTVEYAIQRTEVETDGVRHVAKKPFGTGHAVLSAHALVNTPFAVINADDYYGPSAYKNMCEFLTQSVSEHNYSMIGYVLGKTLSEHGAVSRAVCDLDSGGFLTGIVEHLKVDRSVAATLPDNALVSMNFWGFHPSIFAALDSAFDDHLREEKYIEQEFYLQTVIDKMIAEQGLKISVIPSEEQWYGITYNADKEAVRAALRGRGCDFASKG